MNRTLLIALAALAFAPAMAQTETAQPKTEKCFNCHLQLAKKSLTKTPFFREQDKAVYRSLFHTLVYFGGACATSELSAHYPAELRNMGSWISWTLKLFSGIKLIDSGFLFFCPRADSCVLCTNCKGTMEEVAKRVKELEKIMVQKKAKDEIKAAVAA